MSIFKKEKKEPRKVNWVMFRCAECSRLIPYSGMARRDAASSALCDCDQPNVCIETIKDIINL